jgi:5'-phosphate synthase pdxT subunit
LALQGGFAAHARALRALGAGVREVRRAHELEGLGGLVLPGGESTAMLKLMGGAPWFEALRRFHGEGGALFGTCAGAILLARAVRPQQPSLGLLDMEVERNAYGRQVESFEAGFLAAPPLGEVRGVFIRAPRVAHVGAEVEVLARFGGAPVLVRQGRTLAATFHPELTGRVEVHRLFLESCRPTPLRRAS